jgi:hypothetical protein
MTAYIADKLNMTVDTDIFRGRVPINIDGCAVVMLKKQMQNTATSQRYEFSVICIDSERDKVMQTIRELETNFPVYGESIVPDGGEAINMKAVLSDFEEFTWQFADNGKLKTQGELLLIVVI